LFIVLDTLYESDPERPFLLGIVVAHEVAHQWWYAVIGNNVLLDPWQDESLAVFSSILYQQNHQQGDVAGTLRFYEQTVAALESGYRETGINQSLEAFEARPQLYGTVVYTKGGLFFVELRAELGDEVFFQALQDYYRVNRYRLAPPGRLLQAFEKSCGCELDELYARWGVE
jgi:aminopeptidase N